MEENQDLRNDNKLNVRVQVIEDKLSNINNDFINFKQSTEEKLEQKFKDIQIKLDEISSMFVTYDKDLENKLTKYTVQINDNLVMSINSKFESAHKKLNSDVEKLTGELNGKFESLTASQNTELNTISAQAKKEISGAIELSKTDLENLKESTESQINVFITKSEKSISTKLTHFTEEYSESESIRDKEYQDLKSRIESLLPEASAVGIAKAFQGAKTSRLIATYFNQIISYITILFIFYLAFKFYQDNKDLVSTMFRAHIQNYGEIFISFLRFFAVETPLCWLAVYTAKKAHQNQRVYEEYAHKYATALTYVGFVKETKENPTIYGDKAVESLTDSFRDAVFRNPSEMIDKKVEISNPLIQLIEAISTLSKDNIEEVISILQNIPKKSK